MQCFTLRDNKSSPFELKIQNGQTKFAECSEMTKSFEPAQERLDEFNRVVLNGLKEFFYNIRDDVKNNYDQIQKKILDTNLLNKIEYIPEKKPRGRPKKSIETTLEDSNTNKKIVSTSIKSESESDSDELIIINRPTRNKKHLL